MPNNVSSLNLGISVNTNDAKKGIEQFKRDLTALERSAQTAYRNIDKEATAITNKPDKTTEDTKRLRAINAQQTAIKRLIDETKVYANQLDKILQGDILDAKNFTNTFSQIDSKLLSLKKTLSGLSKNYVINLAVDSKQIEALQQKLGKATDRLSGRVPTLQNQYTAIASSELLRREELYAQRGGLLSEKDLSEIKESIQAGLILNASKDSNLSDIQKIDDSNIVNRTIDNQINNDTPLTVIVKAFESTATSQLQNAFSLEQIKSPIVSSTSTQGISPEEAEQRQNTVATDIQRLNTQRNELEQLLASYKPNVKGVPNAPTGVSGQIDELYKTVSNDLDNLTKSVANSPVLDASIKESMIKLDQEFNNLLNRYIDKIPKTKIPGLQKLSQETKPVTTSILGAKEQLPASFDQKLKDIEYQTEQELKKQINDTYTRILETASNNVKMSVNNIGSLGDKPSRTDTALQDHKILGAKSIIKEYTQLVNLGGILTDQQKELVTQTMNFVEQHQQANGEIKQEVINLRNALDTQLDINKNVDKYVQNVARAKGAGAQIVDVMNNVNTTVNKVNTTANAKGGLFNKMSQGETLMFIQQASWAIQDFAILLPTMGIRGGLMGASNNLTQMVMTAGPMMGLGGMNPATSALITGLGAAGLALSLTFIPLLFEASDELKEFKTGLAENTKEIANNRKQLIKNRELELAVRDRNLFGSKETDKEQEKLRQQREDAEDKRKVTEQQKRETEARILGIGQQSLMSSGGIYKDKKTGQTVDAVTAEDAWLGTFGVKDPNYEKINPGDSDYKSRMNSYILASPEKIAENLTKEQLAQYIELRKEQAQLQQQLDGYNSDLLKINQQQETIAQQAKKNLEIQSAVDYSYNVSEQDLTGNVFNDKRYKTMSKQRQEANFSSSLMLNQINPQNLEKEKTKAEKQKDILTGELSNPNLTAEQTTQLNTMISELEIFIKEIVELQRNIAGLTQDQIANTDVSDFTQGSVQDFFSFLNSKLEDANKQRVINQYSGLTKDSVESGSLINKAIVTAERSSASKISDDKTKEDISSIKDTLKSINDKFGQLGINTINGGL